MKTTAMRAVIISTMIVILTSGIAVTAQEVWTGYDCEFSKADFADWNDPANQDRMIDSVWITRKDNEGIFNIFSETGYVTNFSPENTEWSYGTADQWPSLTFSDWRVWARSQGSVTSIIGQDAVVHLINEDIYLDIRFTGWTDSNQGGGFSYVRACEPVIPTPTPTGTECINNGDVTLDSELTAGDAQLAFQVALGSYSPGFEEECAADCNGDGNVTAGDAQAIFFAVLGTGTCADPV